MGSNPIISTTLFGYDMLTAMGDVMRTTREGLITTVMAISLDDDREDILYITPSGWKDNPTPRAFGSY